MFEFTNLIMLGVGGYLLLGRKDVVGGAKVLGRMVGRGVVHAQDIRNRVTTAFTDESLRRMRPELAEGMKSLMEMQSQLRSATINPFQSMQSILLQKQPQEAPQDHPKGKTTSRKSQKRAEERKRKRLEAREAKMAKNKKLQRKAQPLRRSRGDETKTKTIEPRVIRLGRKP